MFCYICIIHQGLFILTLGISFGIRSLREVWRGDHATSRTTSLKSEIVNNWFTSIDGVSARSVNGMEVSCPALLHSDRSILVAFNVGRLPVFASDSVVAIL